MQRISTANRAISLFGAGKDGFADGNLATGQQATFLNAAIFNTFQEELAAIVETTGVALNPAANNQVITAINALIAAAGVTAAAGALTTAQANLLFAPLAGKVGQAFVVANAVAANQAVALGQAQSLFAPLGSTGGSVIGTTDNSYIVTGGTPQRTNGTSYTNTTGKFMRINVCAASGGTASTILLIVNSITRYGSSYPVLGAVGIDTLVPPGATYSVGYTGSTGSLVSWIESI